MRMLLIGLCFNAIALYPNLCPSADIEQVSDTEALKTAAFFTGTLIAGEAVALWIGMHVLSGEGNPWISPQNDALLLLDMLTGFGLMEIALSEENLEESSIFGALVALGIFTHLYREVEYFSDSENKFLFNQPLFAVNSIKLVGLICLQSCSRHKSILTD